MGLTSACDVCYVRAATAILALTARMSSRTFRRALCEDCMDMAEAEVLLEDARSIVHVWQRQGDPPVVRYSVSAEVLRRYQGAM